MIESTRPDVTIVIRAFNEERWLPEVLDAIDSQEYRNFEVVLVDSGSVDQTRDIAERAGARVVRLRPDDFTFGHSLNVGIEAARGEFIVALSAHAIPTDRTWLERLVAPVRDPGTPYAYGRQRGNEFSKLSELLDFERVFGALPRRHSGTDAFANNANAALRRDAWMDYPFDESLTGLEDIAWARYWVQRGRPVVYEPAACIWHIHTENWAQVRRRYHREAMAAHAMRLADRSASVRVLAAEAKATVADLIHTVRNPGRVGRVGEILRFRYAKALGTIEGMRDGRNVTQPDVRREMYFQQAFPAVVIHGPGEAHVEERIVPSLRPGEVLVRVAYQGICATDLEIFDGTLDYYRSGVASYPIVPGHECSGTVAAVGARVSDLAEHDRVVVECIQGCGSCAACGEDNAISCHERREVGVMGHDGGYANFLVTRARYVHRIPERLTLRQAALVEPLAVVMKGLRRLQGAHARQAPRRCAVIGAGTIGHLAAKVLHSRGHEVTVFDRESARLERIGEGIRTSSALEGLERFEWLIEATGNAEVLDSVLSASCTGSCMLLLGLPYGKRVFSFEGIVGFDRLVVGSVGSSARDYREALASLGTFDMSPFLRSAFALHEFRAAWAAVRERRHLKVMLHVDSSAA